MARAKQNSSVTEIQVLPLTTGRMVCYIRGITPLIYNAMSSKARHGAAGPGVVWRGGHGKDGHGPARRGAAGRWYGGHGRVRLGAVWRGAVWTGEADAGGRG